MFWKELKEISNIGDGEEALFSTRMRLKRYEDDKSKMKFLFSSERMRQYY